MDGNESKKSFGELPTLGRPEPADPEVRAEGPSWSETEMSRAETLRPPEGIRDEGRTDAVRRWKAGETILDRYVVERELGQGGMGVVYGCLDRVGGVRVAVKCLPPELSHNSVEMEEVRENFRLVYGLSHPNIAGARYLERDGNGVCYLVMEEAAGENLRHWLRAKWKAGGVSLAECVGILRQVASALDYAHGEKVIHRDVKPGNVMIDARGRVKVLDFGLASQIRTSLSRASHASRGTSGTGPYMAPEQWRGRRQDGKTDQYALGVMAYEMLAGHLPFENDEVSVLREVVLKEDPEDIPGVPEGTMAAIRRAMSKNAADRFPACGAFVDALESTASQGRASTPCEPEKGTAAGTAAGRTARPEGSPHQNRKGLGVGGWVAAAMLAAGVVAGVWLWREQRSPHQAGDTKTFTLPGGATMEMVWCPPGSFTMGSNTGDDDEKPPHEVKLTEGFWMAKTEVTQEQWKSVMGTTVRQLRDKANPSRRIYGEGPNLPMYYVSWEDAQEFCRRAGHGLQLPTEAQWEYACRARTTGDCAGDIDQMAWYGEGRKGSTHPVGQKQANAWGLHDMHGNVWEWCADCYDRGYYAKSPVANPKGPVSGGYRVLRGGSCWSDPRYCRSAGRSWDNPDLRFRLLGFRPVARQD